MNTLKRAILSCAFVCALAVSGFAQSSSDTITLPPHSITNSGVLLRSSPASDSFSYYVEEIESVKLVDGKIEVVKRSTAMPSIIPAVACLPDPCDWTIRKVWKEIYGVKNGKITLEKTIEGKIIPTVAESVEWPR